MLKSRKIFTLYCLLSLSTLSAQSTDPSAAREQLLQVEALLDAAKYRRADSLLQDISPAIAALDIAELNAGILRLNGYLALEQANYDRASRSFKEAVTLVNRTFPKTDPLIGQAYNDLGRYFFNTGQLDSARYCHQRALTIRLEHFGARHAKVADSYNNLANIYQTVGRSSEALSYYEKALSIRRAHSKEAPTELASALNNIGNAYQSLGDLKRATQAFRQTLDIRIQVLGPDHPQYGRSLQNLGNVFYETGLLDSAQFYYEIALENARLNYAPGHPQLANLYENLGNCALSKNQLDLAESRHQQALEIREVQSNADPVAPATSYLHLGDVKRKKGDYRQAMELTEKGWQRLTQYLQSGDPYLADAWEKLGLCHESLGHFFEAREAMLTALQIRENFYGPNHPLVAGVYTNLGNAYWQQEDHTSAIYYYQKALDIWQQFGPQHRQEQAEAYSNIGNSHLREKSWTAALEAYRRALALLSDQAAHLRAAVWQQIGVVYDGLKQYSAALNAYQRALYLFHGDNADRQSEILFTHGARANTLLHIYQDTGNTDTLKIAAASFTESLQLLSERQLNAVHTESRQKSLALHYDLFEGSITCQLALWQLEKDSSYLWKAFQWSEASKGLRLREKWSELEMDAVLSTTPLAVALQTDDATAAALQKQLDTGVGLLAFFAGPKRLFWFYLQNGRLRAGTISGIPELNQLIANLGYSLTEYPMAGSEQQIELDSLYRSAAGALYRKVWLPIADQFDTPNSLIIVPDGALAYLPFAVLLTEIPKDPMRYRTYPYLLRDHQIGYAYSTALLARALQLPPITGKSTCLAVAPVFDGYDPPLAPLTYNTVEVDGLADQIGASTLKGKTAGRDQFLEMARDYRILHLATHGVANIFRSEFSYLAFSLPDSNADGRLFVEDLYQLDLPADLIVMSACESGVGRFQAGEGAISLGRGFTVAGARSIIATLWNVNDAKTANFMQTLYRYMTEGQTKDAAIRATQLAYIEQAGQADAHPFYWAAYLPIGDMAPLELDQPSRWWLITGLFLLLLGTFWWFRTHLLKNLSK